MALIQTADERLSAEGGIKAVILGPAKIGKTSLVKTLDTEGVLVIDMEAGMLALDDCGVDSINVRQTAVEMGIHPFELLQHLACIIAGPNPAVLDPNEAFSQAHHAHVISLLGDRETLLGKYHTLFFDSITDTSRFCFSWAQTRPEAFSDKKLDAQGNPAKDGRGAYGLLKQSLVGANGFFNQLKHTGDKHIIFVGLLDRYEDEYSRVTWEPQLEGSATKRELAGIFDQIITLIDIDFPGSGKHRAFVCQKVNDWGYPAGDRSGRLGVVEEPHLGKLLAKIRQPKRTVALEYGVPQAAQPEASAAA